MVDDMSLDCEFYSNFLNLKIFLNSEASVMIFSISRLNLSDQRFKCANKDMI